MARKIIIDFSAQPVVGKGFEYSIFINGVALVYNNALTSVTNNYSNLVNDDLNIQIQATLSETIDNTIAWLGTRYVSSAIVYSRVGNTIEVAINSNEYIVVNFGSSNINIATSSEAIIQPGLGLRYYFQYKNIVGDDYLCQIAKKNYTGVVTEIFGKAVINKGSVKDHLEVIRGGGISLELEASLLVSLEDLYTENEQDFTVKLYKNNKLIFSGYLNPEGVYQSFTRDQWIITLDCVDGLGSLSNLSFVDPLGVPFQGKMKAIDIVYYCLNRSGIILPINVSINTTYEGLPTTADTEILSKIYLNGNRYQKSDNDTIMSCEEVLKSVLDLFCACITQENGEWYIYKPNEIFIDRNVVFKMYDINNVYLGRKTVKLDKQLGSQINNFYPHHCNGDQKIQIKGSISAFRINYKYGFVDGLLVNSGLEHTPGSLAYPGWTVVNPTLLINDPLSGKGAIFKDATTSNNDVTMYSNPLATTTDDYLTLKIRTASFKSDGSFGGKFFRFKIQQGSHYLQYNCRTNTTPISDFVNAVWTTNPTDVCTINVFGESEINLVLPTLLDNGNVIVSLIRFVPWLTNQGLTIVREIDLIPSANSKPEIGEFHTSSRTNRVSSNVKENKTIYNGDNGGIIYLGAIFKEDSLTPTSVWNRKNSYESSPILKIATQEELRISQRPTKIFEGSTYGQLPYLSVIEINGLDGVFMPIEYSYDTMVNTSKMKLLELFCPELSDLEYKFTYDFGNTVKPTIQG
jgi:hypothetical protein